MKGLIVVVAIVFLFGCQTVERPKKPENLIPKEKMVDVLTESYLANAARGVGVKNLLVRDVRIDSLIYTKFGIDSAQFARSNEYYAADVNEYIAIFERVEAKLAAMDKALDSIRAQAQQVQDSVVNKEIEEQRRNRNVGGN